MSSADKRYFCNVPNFIKIKPQTTAGAESGVFQARSQGRVWILKQDPRAKAAIRVR